jgi:hypothetical protein
MIAGCTLWIGEKPHHYELFEHRSGYELLLHRPGQDPKRLAFGWSRGHFSEITTGHRPSRIYKLERYHPEIFNWMVTALRQYNL